MTEDERWLLLRQVPADRARNIQAELTVIRQIPPVEQEEIFSKIKLIHKYFSSWQWAKVVNAANSFMQIVYDAANISNKSSHIINDADVRKANLAIRETARTIVEWLDSCHAMATARDNEVLQHALSQAESSTSPIANLQKIHASNAENIVEFNIESLTPFTFTATLSDAARRVAEIEHPQDAVQFLHAAMRTLELVAEAELIAQKESLLDCCRHFRQLQLDCLYGIAILSKESDIVDMTTGGGSVSLTQLPLAGAELVMSNVRRASESLAVRSGQAREQALHGFVPSAMKPQASELPHEDIIENRAQAEESAIPLQTNESQLTEPIDLALLASETRKLPEEIERRWSQSLGVTLAEDHHKLYRRIQSYISAAGSILANSSDAFEKAHAGQSVTSFPPSVEVITAIANDVTEGSSTSGKLTAEIYALFYLKSALASLANPAASSVTLNDGKTESWWASGAFSNAQKLVDSMTQLSNELAATKIETAKEHIKIDAVYESWRFYAQKAQQEIRSGSIESSVVHCSRAANLWSREVAELDKKDFRRSRRHDLRDAIDLVHTIANSIASGEKFSLATLWCIAGFWNDLFMRWMSEEMEMLHKNIQEWQLTHPDQEGE
ncbi:hypothetical protein [Amycolatopsis sp. lyj-90]|uniref:hypothetical protein n=1 Tax=Amycolatopsis sp. lyj-90 TaxID=2789285 RepID=UPI003978A867